MNENKKTKSISRKINNRKVSRLFFTFLSSDILLLLISVFSWCYAVEKLSFGTVDLMSTRGFKMQDNIFTTVYICRNSHDKTIRIPMEDFIEIIAICMAVVVLSQIIHLTISYATGAGEIRKYLSPLDELAFKAQVLGNTTSFDQNAIDKLESAIKDISPTKTTKHLHTGNAEMQSLEAAINNLLDRMRESYRQQSRFVSDASHELRTPLSVLQGYVDMLDRWGKNDPKILDESIMAIKSETKHMNLLVEQLLFLARGDSGKTHLSKEDFSLNDMLNEVYDESLMIDNNHNYRFLPDSETITVNGDISMLKQTARILVDNAAKYTPDGNTIIIKSGIKDDKSPYFTISDEGIGIPRDDISHVFERFYRSDPSRDNKVSGTGLGLSIAKWIIDKHGGHFEVLSSEDLGTRITVFL